MILVFNETIKYDSCTASIGNHKKQVDFKFRIRISHPTYNTINLIERMTPMEDILKRTGYTKDELMEYRTVTPQMNLKLIFDQIAIWTKVKEGDTVFDPFFGNKKIVTAGPYGSLNGGCGNYKVLNLSKPVVVKSFKPRRVDFTTTEDGTIINSSIFISFDRASRYRGDLYTEYDKSRNNKTKIHYLFGTLQGQIEKKRY